MNYPTTKRFKPLLFLCAAVAAILLWSFSPARAGAGETISCALPEAVGGLTPGSAEEYLSRLMYPDGRIRVARGAGSRLEGADAQIYAELAEEIPLIAAGERASTVFTFPCEEIYPQTTYTAGELGVSSLIDGGAFAQDAVDAMTEIIHGISVKNVIAALRQDMPYEMYWAGLTWSTAYPGLSTNGQTVWMTGSVTVSISVAQEYSAGAYQVDTSWGRRAADALENANAVIATYAGSSDYEMLLGYKDAICGMVSYNHAAADDSSTPYGNPWQLIWVFDGDDNTEVVCEGYSKAFKYLVDRSDTQAVCYTVSGTMNGGTGAGAHMWNTVGLDGRWYLVDVTNCDEGSVGHPDALFMRGWAGAQVHQTVTAGGVVDHYTYVFSCNRRTVRYECDSSPLLSEELVFSEDNHAAVSDESNHLTARPAEGCEDYYTAEYGTPLTLAVEAGCDEGALQYQWWRYVGNTRWSLAEQGPSLEVTVQDGHCQYICVVTDDYGESAEVVFIVHLDNLTVADCNTSTGSSYTHVGDEVTLWVEAACRIGQPSYSWYYVTSDASTLLADETDSSLTVTVPALPAQYTCVVSDEFGSAHHVIFDLYYDNHLAVTNYYVSKRAAVPGDTVTMRVDAECSEGDLTYEWFRDLGADEPVWLFGQPLYEANEVLLEGENDHILTLVVDELPAKYVCRVRDQYGNVKNEDFRIVYDNHLTAQALQERFLLSPGETAALQVESSCTIGEPAFAWSVYDAATEQWIELEETGPALTVTADASHRYQCIVTDNFESWAYVYFTVDMDNHLTVLTGEGSTSQLSTVTPGDSLTLAAVATCDAGGLTYAWRRCFDDGANVTTTLIEDCTESTLRLENIQEAADYMCTVADDYGNEATIWFTIRIDNRLEITSITPAIPTCHIDDGESVVLSVTAVCGAGGLSYRWTDMVNQQALDETGSSLTVTRGGYYRCSVTDDYGDTVQQDFEVHVGTLTALHPGLTVQKDAAQSRQKFCFSFTPARSGAYALRTLAELPIYIVLYDADWCATRGAEDLLEYSFTAGETVYFEINCLQPDFRGAIDVKLNLTALDGEIEPDLTLPAGTVGIESQAFAGIPECTAVYVPDTVTDIAPDAFDPGTIIVTPEGSPAGAWAEDQGFFVLYLP